MSIASDAVAAVFRPHWARRFVDEAVILRQTGETFNETTGQTEPVFTQIHAGPCLVRPRQSFQQDFGEERREELRYNLFLPHDVPDLEKGDQVTVTSTLNPDIPVLTVLSGPEESYQTKQHYECEFHHA